MKIIDSGSGWYTNRMTRNMKIANFGKFDHAQALGVALSLGHTDISYHSEDKCLYCGKLAIADTMVFSVDHEDSLCCKRCYVLHEDPNPLWLADK